MGLVGGDDFDRVPRFFETSSIFVVLATSQDDVELRLPPAHQCPIEAGRDGANQGGSGHRRHRKAVGQVATCTARARSAIEKNTWSGVGGSSTGAVAPHSPPAERRCRSIHTVSSPAAFAGAWS